MTLPNKMMIVEDNLSTQKILKSAFNALNILETEYFRTGIEALNSFQPNKYEVILMDIELKGSMDGIQLSKKLLKQFDIPIVFMTGHSDIELFSEVLEIAPYGFLQKPFTLSELQRTLLLAYTRYLSENNKFMQKTTSIIPINGIYSYSKKDKHLYKNKEKVKLNIKEYKLLEILISNINKVVSFDKIIYQIWDEAPVADSSLRTLIYSIKRKLPKFPIVSYSKLGYSLTQEY